ncbi:glycerol-3-phosphate dehydrogenase, partial [Goodea atripinnis]
QEFDVRAKCVINATGPFTDSLRQMDKQEISNICQPSAGVHIVIPGYYRLRKRSAIEWFSTSDGRVIFFLPWENMTIAGTTDTPTNVTAHPIPGEDDINFILREVRNYLSPDVEGGKWTTYRSMAEETLDAAIKSHSLSAEPCRTVGLMLEGAKGWTPTLYIRLVQDYGLEKEVAQHLASTYGAKAFDVAKMAKVTGQRWPIVGKRLVSEFPYIEAEVKLSLRQGTFWFGVLRVSETMSSLSRFCTQSRSTPAPPST